jgi:glycosyltransferase involved in cell wall biosynthesis
MDTRPLISIVTPSFNQGKFIEQTIRSVLEQSYTNVELWVVDGGSTDETISILQKYQNDPRFHFISEPDSGQSEAINKGLHRVRGEIFNWLNSDDYLEPGSLEHVAQGLSSEVRLFSGKVRKFEEPGGETTGYYELELEKQAEDTLALGRYCQPSTFWRTETFREIGGVQQTMHCAMDYHLWAKYLAKYCLEGVRKTDKIFAHFREHKDSKSALLNRKFKDEINGVYLDLLKKLNAPQLLCKVVRQQTSHEYSTSWILNPQFNGNRFMALLAYENARKRYYEHDYAHARELVKLSRDLHPLFDAWRLKCKLLFKP